MSWSLLLLTIAPSAAQDFFAKGAAMPRLDIRISTDNQMKLFHEHRTYVPATVIEGGQTYEEVAVRLKGNEDGSYRGLHDKAAMTLNFDRFKDGQLFHGLDKLYLNNAVEDPSLMAETISTELFAAAGIPVPRVTFVRVSLNGQERGVYVLKEGFNKRFLKRYFRSPDGNFYDGGLVSDIDEELQKSSGQGPDDRSDLAGLAKAAQQLDPARRWTELGQWVDLKQLVTFMAMEVMTGHYDGYCMNRNNYRVYRDPASDRFVFMPTGMDIMFSDPENDIEPYMDGLVARAVIETEPGRARFYQVLGELYSQHFVLEKVLARLEELDRELRPALQSLGTSALTEYRSGVEDLRRRIQLRHQTVARCLRTPAPEPLGLEPKRHVRLAGWLPRDEFEQAELGERSESEIASLYIGTTNQGVYSWRVPVWLEPGSYRLEGRARTEAVEGYPLAFGDGAGLRVTGLGLPQRPGLMGTQDWRTLRSEFVVEPGPGPIEVELVCELIAKRGKAWFDLESLRLIRLVDN